jgi:hypothetical protein
MLPEVRAMTAIVGFWFDWHAASSVIAKDAANAREHLIWRSFETI